jgi:hypothetical protein
LVTIAEWAGMLCGFAACDLDDQVVVVTVEAGIPSFYDNVLYFATRRNSVELHIIGFDINNFLAPQLNRKTGRFAWDRQCD